MILDLIYGADFIFNSFRASLAAHSLFVERLAKVSQFSAGSGMVDLANVLQQLINAEKEYAKCQATTTASLDNVIEPLSERVAEWRKSDPVNRQQQQHQQQRTTRLLRKGSSTENLINKMGSVMTLSRKSRKPSRDRKISESERHQPPPLAMVSRDTLTDTATEAQARMAIFARSMSPYIQVG